MYQTPIVARGFNHQSFYRQPVSNLRQVTEIVSNRNNETQNISNMTPISYSLSSNEKSVSNNVNRQQQTYSTLNDNIKQRTDLRRELKEVNKQSTQPILYYQESNSANHLPNTFRIDNFSKQRMNVFHVDLFY